MQNFFPMGVESYLVLWVFTDECCHPNRVRVELMLIESFEIGRLDFPNRDTLKSTHCFCLTTIRRKFVSSIPAFIEGTIPVKRIHASSSTECFRSAKPKLLDQVRDAIRLRHYSLRMGQAYSDGFAVSLCFTTK